MRITAETLLAAIEDADTLADLERALARQAARSDTSRIVDFFEVPTGDAFDVAPEAAIAFFKAKGLKQTFSYADMIGEAQDHAFTIAKMMDVDMLGQVRASMESALANGTTFKEWRDELMPILQASGWWGRKEVVDPITGQTIVAQLGSPSRLETIFRTNLQGAYAAGQWQEIQEQAQVAPYLMYDAVDDHRTRPQHRAWDQTVLPTADPWWQTHYPPNGYNCRCGVIQLDAEEVAALGLAPAQAAPNDGTYTWQNPRTGEKLKIPEGLDPGFDRNSGANYLARLKTLLQEKIGALPADMQASAQAAIAKARQTAALAAKVKKALNEKAGKAALARANAKAAEKAKQWAAQKQLDQIKAGTHPGIGIAYKQNALKTLSKIAGWENGTPAEQLSAVLAKAQQLKQKTETASKISTYKKAVLAGKVPAPSLVKAFKSLPDADQIKIAGEIAEKQAAEAAKKAAEEAAALKAAQEAAAAAKAAQAAAEKTAKKAEAAAKKKAAQAAEAKAAQAGAPIIGEAAPPNPAALVMTKPKTKGGTPGAFYQDSETGTHYLVKFNGSEDAVRNEVLAGKLYNLAGLEAPEMHAIVLDGQPALASRIIDGIKQVDTATLARTASVQEGFAVDAWLANWDAIGMDADNTVLIGRRAIRIDVGGALRYRAVGGLKGQAFRDTVGELESMRDAALNEKSAAVFGSVTPAQIEAGVAKVLRIADDDIRTTVMRYGPPDPGEAAALADRLIARKRDLAARYPDVAARVAKESAPKPAPKPAARVTAEEYQRVRDARSNGYAFQTDGDQIEDQSVLVSHYTGADGKDYTRGWLKVRPVAAMSLQKRINEALTTSPDRAVDLSGVNEHVLQTVKGINLRAAKGLEQKDFARMNAAIAEIEKSMERLTDAAADAVSMTPDMIKAHKELRFWRNEFARIVNTESVGSRVETLRKFNPIGIVRYASQNHKATSGAIKWQRHGDGLFVQIADIERGHARMTGKTEYLNGTREHYTAELPDGTRLTYIADTDANSAYAMRGTLQIDAPGATTASSTRVFEAMKEIGIDDRRASQLDVDELFANRLARIHEVGDAAFRKQYDAIDVDVPDQAARVKAKLALLKQKTGTNIEKTNAWATRNGVRQAFEHGRAHQLRPDLETPEFAEWEKKNLLYHNMLGLSPTGNDTSGTWARLKRVIAGGGQMAANADKVRRGISIQGGASPDSDMETGGAAYIFARIKSKLASKGEGVYWRASALRRMDAISYDGDKFGNVKPGNGHTRYSRGVADFEHVKKNSGNETIFKNGLSVFDAVEKIVLHDAAEVRQAISDMQAMGYTAWPDGRRLEDIFKARH